MNKGFIATLFAAITFAGVSSAFASAPVISPLPDITIGDAEEEGATQNNYFVFTNAFRFDDQVVDTDTPIANLQWSFVEGIPATQWYTVNDIAPTNFGGAGNLRAGHPYASFRDIVFSPGSGPLTSAFPTPSENHSAGKVVTFVVSDGINSASADCIVNSVDNGVDSISGGAQMITFVDDPLTSDPRNSDTTPGAPNSGFDGWSKYDMGDYAGGGNRTDCTDGWDSTNGALTVHVTASGTAQNAYGNNYRIGGWQSNLTEWLKWGSVLDDGNGSTDNYVRAKFYVYAAPAAGTNTIPNLRFRVSQRFAVEAQLEANSHMSDDPKAQVLLQDLTPSTDPANPSIYRVDFAPIRVPYLATHSSDEGIQLGFEAYSIYAVENGTVGLTEAVVGTYPAALVKGTPVRQKLYQTSASDAGDLKVFGSATDIANQNLALVPGVFGAFAPADTTGTPLGLITGNSTGVTIDTANVPATISSGSMAGWQIVACPTRNFNPDGNADGLTAANNAARMRVKAGEVYVTRWHLTSTQNTALQSEIRLRTRAVKFGWTMKYGLLGGATASSKTRPISQQALPGVGCLNPEKDGSENGGWYTSIMTSPIDPDINPNQSHLTTEPGPGSPNPSTWLSVPGTPANSGTDIFVSMDVVDSLQSFAEKANVTLDKIELKAYASPRD